MKVIFVLPRLRRTGGTERTLAEILPALVARGIDPVVVALAPARTAPLDEDLRAAGIDVRVLGSRHMRDAAGAIRGMIDDERPGLVNSALSTANLAARLGARRTGVPVLTTVTNTCRLPAQLDREGIARWRLRRAWAVDAWGARHLTAHFHAVSHSVGEWTQSTWRIPGDRVTVVYCSRDPALLGESLPARRRAVRARLGIADDAPVVLNVGRQHAQKGQVDLVEAMGRLAGSHPTAILLVAGLRDEGISRAMEATAATYGISDRVRLLGHRDDVPDLLAAADLFAFPSRWEGLGCAVIEALALRLPVVASDIPPVREAAGDGALYVPPAAPDQLAGTIAKVLDDPALASELATAGLAHFRSTFLPDTVADQMTALFHAVARG